MGEGAGRSCPHLRGELGRRRAHRVQLRGGRAHVHAHVDAQHDELARECGVQLAPPLRRVVRLVRPHDGRLRRRRCPHGGAAPDREVSRRGEGGAARRCRGGKGVRCCSWAPRRRGCCCTVEGVPSSGTGAPSRRHQWGYIGPRLSRGTEAEGEGRVDAREALADAQGDELAVDEGGFLRSTGWWG